MSVRALSKFFNLGIDQWEPNFLPEPSHPVIKYDGKNKSFQQIFTDLVLQTYQIRNDSDTLKRKPVDFERFRGDYPVRREFKAYTLRLDNVSEEYMRKLRRLGFRILKT
jgi:erythronate-4-phosphate dehydrogenase